MNGYEIVFEAAMKVGALMKEHGFDSTQRIVVSTDEVVLYNEDSATSLNESDG